MKRICVISPHPDDEAIGCGGAILQLRARGHAVRVIFLTSGEKGGHGRSEDVTRTLRETEAHRAAKILGLSEIVFWRAPDGALRATASLVARLRSELRAWRADTVFVPHPLEMHPDHRAAAKLVRAATRKSRHPIDVYFYEVWTPLTEMDLIQDISQELPRKMQAIRAYRSQCREVDFAAAVQGLNRYRGELHSWPGGNYAEAFKKAKP